MGRLSCIWLSQKGQLHANKIRLEACMSTKKVVIGIVASVALAAHESV